MDHPAEPFEGLGPVQRVGNVGFPLLSNAFFKTFFKHFGVRLLCLHRVSGKSRENDRLDYATEQGVTASGRLNPQWVEWLMGYPIGWTALNASETPSFRKSRKSSAKPS
jgi:hypothetical protein